MAKKVCFNSFAILFAAFRAEKILTVSESIEDEYIFSRFIDKKLYVLIIPFQEVKYCLWFLKTIIKRNMIYVV